jgi:glycosyltransferase involved in cell wall biosynthesis
MSISVIIPAFNEEQLLPSTLKSIRCITEIAEIIVVDDASTDQTAEVARLHADVIISLPRNVGKGEALYQGFQQASGDILLFLDSDLAESAALARDLMLPVLRGGADMSIAVFPPSPKKAGFGLVRALARYGIRTLTGYEATAPLSGQRAVTREAATLIRSWDGRFGIEVGMTIDILRGGLSVHEVPIPFRHRQTSCNWSGFIHRGKQFVDVGRMLAQKWHLQ